jgi:flagellar hook assembly protein FlgD
VSVATGTGVDVTVWVDGAFTASVPTGEPLAQVDVSLPGTVDGVVHLIEVGECPSGSCAASTDGTVTDAISVTAYPAGLDVTRASNGGYLTPNGDGVTDTIALDYTSDAFGDVTATVVRESDAVVVRTIGVGFVSWGEKQFVWDGEDDAGQVVANGAYRVELRLVTNGGSVLADGVTVHVDKFAPLLSKLTSSHVTVLPRKDGYYDSVTLSASISENSTVAQVRIANAAGRTVRTLTQTSVVRGTVRFTWDGRRSSGSILPAGSYSYRWKVRDAAGNARTSRASVTKIDTRILVRRTKARRVTPVAAELTRFVGACSRLVANPNGWRGGHGYYSMWRKLHGLSCPGTPYQDYAEGEYALTLNNLVAAGATLKQAYGTYGTAATSLTPLGFGRTVHWAAGAFSYRYYDVRFFTVTWQYYVLVK